MTLHEFATSRQGELRDSDVDWADRVGELAERLRAELSGSDSLQEAAIRVADEAAKRKVHALTGASRLGDQLAGAVVAFSKGALHLATPADEDVLVLDGLLATGTQIEQAIRRLRRIGAQQVTGLALLAEREALESCRAATGSEVIALEIV
jgi:uracil phosphoribosyltransferase